MKFQGRSAVVTGGASGIGRSIVEAFAREGASVVVADRDRKGSEAVATDVAGRFGVEIAVLEVDLAEPGAPAAMISDASELFGGISILVNNAAVLGAGRLEDLDEGLWDRVMAINLRSVAMASAAAIPIMRLGGGGSIVNVSSVAGLAGEVGLPAYAASKGAIIALSKSMAIDHAADNIRINCVCPGSTRTPLTESLLATVENPEETVHWLSSLLPFQRQGRPEEIAEGVVFLSSDESSYVTGSILVMDGGLTLGFRPPSTVQVTGRLAAQGA